MRLKALIVEDDAVVAMDLDRHLARLGFESAGTAVSGEEAIRLADMKHPQVVLMDIRLKGPIDGIEAAKTIRNKMKCAIVYVTALADLETVRRAAVTQPASYVVKPFDERQIQVALELARLKYLSEDSWRSESAG